MPKGNNFRYYSGILVKGMPVGGKLAAEKGVGKGAEGAEKEGTWWGWPSKVMEWGIRSGVPSWPDLKRVEYK